MLNCKIHFVADFPVLLTLNELPLGSLTKPYDTLSVEIENEQNLLLEVKPISSNYFCESLYYVAEILFVGGAIKTNSNFLEISNYDNTNYEIKVLPITNQIKKKEQVIEKIKINEEMSAIIFDDGVFNIEINSKTKVFRYALKEKIYNVKCEYFTQNGNDFLYFYGKTHKNQDYLIIFNNFFCNLEICGDVIETTHNEIKVLNRQNDIACHGIVQKFSLTQNEFVLNDEYVVLINDEPKVVNEEKLIPLAFCEAVNIKNIKLARTYLDASLNAILTDEHILTFFGNYDEFVWNKYENKDNIICFLYGEQEKTCKKFYFEINKNKITNISCLDWNFFYYYV